MTRLARGLVACAAAGAYVLSPAPATADPRQEVAAVVVANGGEVATLFSTTAGERYRVTVRGAYRHDGTRLADCGHVNNGGAVGSTDYVPVTNLYVNGSPAPCSGQPVSVEHVYGWDVTGTGAPLRFRLVAPPDAAGALQVSVTGHSVTADCHFSVSGLANSGNVLVSIRATATADGASDNAITSLRCTVSNAYGEEVVAQTLAPGPRAAIVVEGILRASTMTVCVEATATWVLGQSDTYADCWS